MSTRAAPLACLALCSVMAACGGSGDDDGAGGALTTVASTSTSTSIVTTSTATATTNTVATTTPATTTTVLADPVSCTDVTVAAGAIALPAERCAPNDAGAGRLPAVLVLNGCGGYGPDEGITSAIARQIAARGAVALRLDYLAVHPLPDFGYCDLAALAAAGPDILKALLAAVATLRTDPAIDPARIGVVGYSLGGLTAGLVQIGGGPFGPLDSAGFGAIGLLSPLVPGQVADVARQGKLPPTAVVVGEADEVVGTATSLALQEAAAAGGMPIDLTVVPGQGHTWLEPRASEAAERLATFVIDRLEAIQPGERT